MAWLRILAAVFAIALVTWLSVTGYVVAPLLFDTLDSVTAGQLVGRLLTIGNWIGLIGLTIVLLINLAGRKKQSVGLHHLSLLWLSGVLIAVSEFWLTPKMEAIKALHPQGLSPPSEPWQSFMMWHGIYQLLFLALIVILLVWAWLNLKSMINHNSAPLG
ncbi:DUF4149 domain-containing protein [Thiomicrorhabdus sp. zzn3]|uniref:DUF4149 domain-containing protein n=1 Tax=Thiomicrorhabdus sp. zzn3 TaxID=3039775 RepID=UPI002436F244|nr:DUF4149 domain-containing protein [Thiomicrorhabdus sp. zzn3]MDG6778221.1 DUF4149 domain-containing protein [Thiomicrorhabdus sp. zzn3]